VLVSVERRGRADEKSKIATAAALSLLAAQPDPSTVCSPRIKVVLFDAKITDVWRFDANMMSTQTIQINCNTRPVRLAFLVDKPDPSTLEKVFQLNTVLWGGCLNPVVVLDGSTRKQLGAHYAYEGSTYEQEQLSLLKAFDPDILVNYSNVQLPAFLSPFKERTFLPDVMRWNPWGTQEMMAFLEVWPFLQQYWRKEFRFLEKPQHQFGYIDLDGSGSLRTYLVARFGGYPEDGNGNSLLADNFDGQRVIYNEDFRKTFTLDEWIFPIHITRFQLEIPHPSTLDNYILFLLDTDSMFDILDYWNLRAAGYRVFPLPISHYKDFAASAKLFAERSAYPINQNVTTAAEVVKGRSVDDSHWEEAGKWFVNLGINAERLSLKGWVPRFRTWERDRRVYPEMQINPPISERSNEVVVFNDAHGTLSVTAPDCELAGPYFSQHWAVELKPFGTTSDERTFRLPWLRPGCDALAELRIGHGHRPYSSRVSKHGITLMQRGEKETVWIEEPKVTEVFHAYLKDGGFAFQGTSTPGLTLERIVEQLGGLSPCAVFKNSGVREIIDTLARGSNRPQGWVKKIISRALSATDDEKKRKELERILSNLVTAKVLRQGFELQCERCRLRDWYHLSDLSEDFRCMKCFRVQQVPHLLEGQWRYTVDGLFRLKGKLAGCLTTILALLFLRHFIGYDVKFVPSFDYTDGPIHGERDFALFASEVLQEDVDVIIGECKSLKEIGENQKDAIKQLGERTGAYLAFCTLSDGFSVDDKLYFEQLVVGRQRPILLTRKHLEMSYMDIGKFQHDPHWLGRDVELLCRLTIKEILGDDFAHKHGLGV
jgi:hypothetical protein